jgi:hypothetical protein
VGKAGVGGIGELAVENKVEYITEDKTILRKPHNAENPYVVITKNIFEDRALSWRAKGMMGYFLSRPDDWTIIIGDLVKRSPEGRTAVRSILNELEKHGYLFKRQLRDEKGHWAGTEMIVLESPLPPEHRTWKPRTRQPHAGNPSTVEPDTGNGPLLSIDSVPSIDLTEEEPASPDSPPAEDHVRTFQSEDGSKTLTVQYGTAPTAPDPVPEGFVEVESASEWPAELVAVGEEPAQEEDVAEIQASFKTPAPRQRHDAQKRHDPDDPIGGMLAAARRTEEARAEVEHPDFTDASKDGHSWAGKPLIGFQALIMTPVLCPADKRNWPNALMKWSESWEDEAPTPEEAYECIKGIKKSEYRWMTFKTPYEDGFKAVMNVMLGRLRAGQPWDCGGDSGRHDVSNGGAKAQAQQEVIQAAMDERFDPETGLSREVMAQREGQ